MSDFHLLTDIAVALSAAFAGGLLARRAGLPTLVGYMLAGIAIGPFTPGFVGDVDTIGQLAELGIIFLMFGVGIHFSLSDLWKVRDAALPGALGRMALMTLLGYGLSQWWGWSTGASVVFGLALSIASTVVLLRGLMDNGLLNTAHGQVAVGWLVVEDLATVLILVLLPSLAPAGGTVEWQSIAMTLLKAAAFVGLMLFLGARAIPWLLLRIAYTRSRELFVLAVLVTALGTALGAAELFGVSLALGAFLGGVVVNESPLSHQIAADLTPFRDTFALLFFVSIGMLVNPLYLLGNWGHILALAGLVIGGKALLTVALGVFIPRPARTALVVAAGSSQIGEFSFILGQMGLALGLLAHDEYALILAGALVSITLNPLLYRLTAPAERLLQGMPPLWERLNHHQATEARAGETLAEHVVVIGYGRVGHHIVKVLGELGVPRLVVELDAERIAELRQGAVPALYGDAANSDVLHYAGLERARALVVTLPDEAAAEIVVATAHERAPALPIIARAATADGVQRLAQLGARDVIHPEQEGGLEIVRHTLMRLHYSMREVGRYADAVRDDHYHTEVDTEAEHRTLHALMRTRHIEVSWLPVPDGSALIGQSLAEANLRQRLNVSLIAILRDQDLVPNPKSATVFRSGDVLGLIGDEQEISAAEQWMAETDG